MTEAVVQLSRLGLREHLVRLDDLFEALVRISRIGNVRVQLAREPPERALDVGFAGRTPDAEHLVVVATRDRHQFSSYTASTKRESSCAAARTERIAFS